MVEKKHIFSVSELTHRIKVLLEGTLHEVWVEGEISNFKHHSSGHMYFRLKDEEAVINAVLFRHINKNFKFKLSDGIAVVCFGKISVYDKSGQYQLYVEKIEPKGAGALQLAFEQLKKRLAQEGLFDEKRKREIPFLPQRIGVVTSPTGAAIRDILHILNRRFANLEVIINPVHVQGKGAAEEIAQAIEEFNAYKKVDVLIVGRGGGSLEDLWAFNEEVVARAIFNSSIPVISAVGHEIDYTISDFVADLRAPTPSAAAEQVVAHKQELVDKIKTLYDRTKCAINNQLSLYESRMESMKERYAFRQPTDLIQQYQQTIDMHTSSLDAKIMHIWQIYQEKCNVLIGTLHALSPLKILSRGYSISVRLPEEKTITSTDELSRGERVRTRLAKGMFESTVEEIIEDGRDKI